MLTMMSSRIFLRETCTIQTPRSQRKEQAMQVHVKAPRETSKGEADLTVEDPAVVEPVEVVEPSVAGRIVEEHTPVAKDRDASDY